MSSFPENRLLIADEHDLLLCGHHNQMSISCCRAVTIIRHLKPAKVIIQRAIYLISSEYCHMYVQYKLPKREEKLMKG